MKRTALATLAITTALLASAVAAQESTDEQLKQKILYQKDVSQQVKNGNLGPSRGLLPPTGDERGIKVVTIDDISPDVSTQGTQFRPLSAESSGAGVEVSSTDGPLTRPNGAGLLKQNDHLSFPEKDQINIRIKFDFDSAAINDTQMPDLQQMCRVMHSTPEVNLFRIIGHTDASGSEEYNERLSRLRAEEVARFLIEDCGIKASRLETVGFGERFLSNPADPEADVNRRVEFQALG